MGILFYFFDKAFHFQLVNIVNKKLVLYAMLFVAFILFCGQANDRNEAYGMYYCVWYALTVGMVIVSQIIKPCFFINNPIWVG